MTAAEKVLHTFVESYSPEAIVSLERVSSDIHRADKTFKGFNLEAVSENFKKYMLGFVETVKAGDTLPERSVVLEQTKDFFEHQITEQLVKYGETSSFVESYLKHVKDLDTVEESTTKELFEAGADPTIVGLIPDIVGVYIEAVSAPMAPVMDYLLAASGYRNSQYMKGLLAEKPAVKTNNYFL